MGLTPYFRRRSLKNGKRIWFKCTFHQMWMLPVNMRFECGDVYQRIQYCFERCAAYYERIEQYDRRNS